MCFFSVLFPNCGLCKRVIGTRIVRPSVDHLPICHSSHDLHPHVIRYSITHLSVIRRLGHRPPVIRRSIFRLSVIHSFVIRPSLRYPSSGHPSIFHPSVGHFPSVTVYHPSNGHPLICHPSVDHFPSSIFPSSIRRSIIRPLFIRSSVINHRSSVNLSPVRPSLSTSHPAIPRPFRRSSIRRLPISSISFLRQHIYP